MFDNLSSCVYYIKLKSKFLIFMCCTKHAFINLFLIKIST